MKKVSLIKLTVSLAVVILLLMVQVSAAVDPAVIDKSSSSLVKLGLLKGDPSGNLKLEDKVTRCEFVTLVIRLMGYDKTTSTDDISLSFKDLDKRHWAYNNIKIAVKRNLLKGYSNNTVGPDNYVTYAEAQAILIRALGYEDTLKGKWPENVVSKANELGLDENVNITENKQLTRGEASVLIYNSLTVDFR